MPASLQHLFSPLYLVWNPTHGMIPPTFSVSQHTSINTIQIIPHGQAERLVSMVILNDSKLTVKSNNHHKYPGRPTYSLLKENFQNLPIYYPQNQSQFLLTNKGKKHRMRYDFILNSSLLICQGIFSYRRSYQIQVAQTSIQGCLNKMEMHALPYEVKEV